MSEHETRTAEDILQQLDALQAENKKLRAELAQKNKKRDGEVEGYNSWENTMPVLGKKGPPININQVKMKALEDENSGLKDTLNQLSGKFDAMMKQMSALQQNQGNQQPNNEQKKK